MDELEESLKRLFQDPRLDVRATADASEKVVAGARRVRRNRIAAISSAGVLSLAVVAGGTVLLARPSGPDTTGVAVQPTDLPIVPTTSTESTPQEPPLPAQPPSTTVRTEPTSPTSSRPEEPPRASRRIGPTSYQSFRLGMAEAEVSRGTTRGRPTASPSVACTSFLIEDQAATITVSKRYGVTSIAVTDAAQTPEGVAIGASQEQLRSAYRDVPGTSTGAITVVPVPGNSAAEYRFTVSNGQVTEITLAAKQQDC